MFSALNVLQSNTDLTKVNKKNSVHLDSRLFKKIESGP